MGSMPPHAAEACHSCRRQRLKCDRTLPRCKKCSLRGEDCLGYGQLLRWQPGVASRGNLVGMTHGQAKEIGRSDKVMRTLNNPTAVDCDSVSLAYLSHFANITVKDLVLYDSLGVNIFRQLLPMVLHNPLLHQIVIASSAMHMSKLQAKALCDSSDHHINSLRAKQKALALLKSSLASHTPETVEIALASVLLFVEFDLIDSGRQQWQYHTKGAQAIMQAAYTTGKVPSTSPSPLITGLMSELMVFDIIGSAFLPSCQNMPGNTPSLGALSLLQDAEGNHCSSFPAHLLQLIQAGSYLLSDSRPDPCKAAEVRMLLRSAVDFDAIAWAIDLQQRSPVPDICHRAALASADRAAVRIYLSRILMILDPLLRLGGPLESLVEDVVEKISLIRPHDALFTAIVWSVFVAGAETDDASTQAWIKARFEELWNVESWGINKGALGLLESIWEKRKARVGTAQVDIFAGSPTTSGSWLEEIRKEGVNWLII